MNQQFIERILLMKDYFVRSSAPAPSEGASASESERGGRGWVCHSRADDNVPIMSAREAPMRALT